MTVLDGGVGFLLIAATFIAGGFILGRWWESTTRDLPRDPPYRPRSLPEPCRLRLVGRRPDLFDWSDPRNDGVA